MATGTGTPAPRPRRHQHQHQHQHHVYVVELHGRVWNEPRLRAANPGYQLGKPFVYVWP
jgi:hypothetical protein